MPWWGIGEQQEVERLLRGSDGEGVSSSKSTFAPRCYGAVRRWQAEENKKGTWELFLSNNLARALEIAKRPSKLRHDWAIDVMPWQQLYDSDRTNRMGRRLGLMAIPILYRS
jgi:hypothetical protein